MATRAAMGNNQRTALLGAVLTAVFCCALFALPGSARAINPIEQTGVFSGSASHLTDEQQEADEEIQLGGATSLAVNRTGAGGVKPGAVYAVTRLVSVKFFGLEHAGTRVAMFYPKPAGGLEFVESWEVNEGGTYERCAPNGQLPGGEESNPCPPRVDNAGGEPKIGIDVDQTTGNVYVFANFETRGAGGVDQVVIYSATGSEVVDRFAEEDEFGRKVGESPAKLHLATSPDQLAVDSASGDVYIYDEDVDFYSRLMVFQPTDASRDDYQYAGEILPNLRTGHASRAPSFDDMGNLYVAGIAEAGSRVEEYSPLPSPSAYPAPTTDVPLCTFTYEKGGMLGMTVDPETGEPFFTSYKKESQLKWVRHLSACDPASGKFTELGKASPTPERGDLLGLAFDPERRATPSRINGVLYGSAPSAVPGNGIGSGEPEETALGYIFGGPVEAPHPPLIESQSVESVTTSSALLRAKINPSSYPTTYAFQYETVAEFNSNPPGERFAGADEAPGGTPTLGGGTEGVFVSTTVTGLSAGTEYRFRVTARNHGCLEEPEGLCTALGSVESFQTFSAQAPGLPDGRTWELVSPASKYGGQVYPASPRIGTCPTDAPCKPGIGNLSFPKQSAPDGNGVAYQGSAFSADEGSALENEYLSRRTADGWQTNTALTPAMPEKGTSAYLGFATNLSRAVILQSGPALSPEAPIGFPDLYSQLTSDPSVLDPVLTSAPPNRSGDGGNRFRLEYGGSSSSGTRVFFQANDALTDGVPGIAPPAPDVGPLEYNLYEWHLGELSLVNVLPDNSSASSASFPDASANGISADGSHAYFTASGRLYVRIDGRETRRIEHDASFLAASADGSKVLLSDGCLYELATEACTDVTDGVGGFKGVAGQSSDLSRIYFVDGKVLDPTPNSYGDSAVDGGNNLYAWAGGDVRFVARLLATDNTGSPDVPGGVADWAPSPSGRSARASRTGRYLALLSTGELTGYDNVGPCIQVSNAVEQFQDAACTEVFLYDAEVDRLNCPSCNPTGVAPKGNSALRLRNTQYLTDTGRLYFDSQDRLVPGDSNGRFEDVYQYEPDGIGSCAKSEGCVSLISAGTEALDANLLDVDQSGENVFFTTADRLVAADTDDQIDLYDARVGGGFESENESEPSQCEGESCQALTLPPQAAIPGSATFSGPGNVKSPSSRSCGKGKSRRHGKCVKKKRKKHRHHNRRTH